MLAASFCFTLSWVLFDVAATFTVIPADVRDILSSQHSVLVPMQSHAQYDANDTHLIETFGDVSYIWENATVDRPYCIFLNSSNATNITVRVSNQRNREPTRVVILQSKVDTLEVEYTSLDSVYLRGHRLEVNGSTLLNPLFHATAASHLQNVFIRVVNVTNMTLCNTPTIYFDHSQQIRKVTVSLHNVSLYGVSSQGKTSLVMLTQVDGLSQARHDSLRIFATFISVETVFWNSVLREGERNDRSGFGLVEIDLPLTAQSELVGTVVSLTNVSWNASSLDTDTARATRDGGAIPALKSTVFSDVNSTSEGTVGVVSWVFAVYFTCRQVNFTSTSVVLSDVRISARATDEVFLFGSDVGVTIDEHVVIERAVVSAVVAGRPSQAGSRGLLGVRYFLFASSQRLSIHVVNVSLGLFMCAGSCMWEEGSHSISQYLTAVVSVAAQPPKLAEQTSSLTAVISYSALKVTVTNCTMRVVLSNGEVRPTGSAAFAVLAPFTLGVLNLPANVSNFTILLSNCSVGSDVELAVTQQRLWLVKVTFIASFVVRQLNSVDGVISVMHCHWDQLRLVANMSGFNSSGARADWRFVSLTAAIAIVAVADDELNEVFDSNPLLKLVESLFVSATQGSDVSVTFILTHCTISGRLVAVKGDPVIATRAPPLPQQVALVILANSLHRCAIRIHNCTVERGSVFSTIPANTIVSASSFLAHNVRAAAILFSRSNLTLVQSLLELNQSVCDTSWDQLDDGSSRYWQFGGILDSQHKQQEHLIEGASPSKKVRFLNGSRLALHDNRLSDISALVSNATVEFLPLNKEVFQLGVNLLLHKGNDDRRCLMPSRLGITDSSIEYAAGTTAHSDALNVSCSFPQRPTMPPRIETGPEYTLSEAGRLGGAGAASVVAVVMPLAAADLQILMAAGLSGCAVGKMKTSADSPSSFVLSPFYAFGEVWMVVGNAGGIVVVALVQGILWLRFVSSLSPTAGNRYLAALSRARAPNLTLRCWILLQQGLTRSLVTLWSGQARGAPSALVAVSSVVGVVCSAGCVAGSCLVQQRLVRPRLDVWTVRYPRRLVARWIPTSLRWVVPAEYWQPDAAKARVGALLGSTTAAGQRYALYPLVVANVQAVLSSLPFREWSLCALQWWLMAVVSLAAAVFVTVVRPCRSVCGSVLSALSYTAIAVMAMCLALDGSGAASGLSVAVSAVGILRGLHSIFVMMWERAMSQLDVNVAASQSGNATDDVDTEASLESSLCGPQRSAAACIPLSNDLWLANCSCQALDLSRNARNGDVMRGISDAVIFNFDFEWLTRNLAQQQQLTQFSMVEPAGFLDAFERLRLLVTLAAQVREKKPLL